MDKMNVASTIESVLFWKAEPISIGRLAEIIQVNEEEVLKGISELEILLRGLVEKVEDKKDQRVFLYKPTFDLLAFLGTKKVEDLPEFDSIRSEFSSFVEQRDKQKDEHDKEQIGR